MPGTLVHYLSPQKQACAMIPLPPVETEAQRPSVSCPRSHRSRKWPNRDQGCICSKCTFFLCVSLQSWPQIPAHSRSAGLSLLGVISLKSAQLSSCLAEEGHTRHKEALPGPGIPRNPRDVLVPTAAAARGWGLPLASPLPPSDTPLA